MTKHHLWGAPYVNWLVVLASVAIFIAMYWILPVVWYAGLPYFLVLVASYGVVARRGRLSKPPDLLAEELAGTPA